MIYLLLPAYNEELAIQSLLERVADVPFDLRVIVVDDGSVDATAEVVARHAHVHLVRHNHNRGLGEAFRTLFGVALAEATADDLLVTMDADNTMDPELIAAMLNEVAEGSDIVIASRFANGREVGVPPLRRLLSRLAWLTLQSSFAVPNVRDYTCGYRMYRVSLLQKLARSRPDFFESNGFTATVELLLNLSALNPKISEVPLVLRYDRKLGHSKMKVVTTVFQYLGLVVRSKLRLPTTSPYKGKLLR